MRCPEDICKPTHTPVSGLFPRPRVTGRGPSDNDDAKPRCGGVLPIFLSVGFHGALNKKRHFTENNVGVGGGGNFIMRNVLRKRTKANLLVTFQEAVLLLSLFEDVIFFH